MSDEMSPRREQLDDLPPSCKYVADVLEHDGPLTRQSLIDRTGLPPRTVDDALDRLENRDYLFKARDSDDLRRVVCNIRSDAQLQG